MKTFGTAVWHGGIKDGTGAISTASGALEKAPYGFSSRFEGKPGTNPEELIGAAHAGCFTMALSLILGEAGLVAEQMDTKATVTLDKVEGGYAITAVHLVLKARIPGTTEAAFQDLAAKAKAGCPVSKLLNAAITLDAAGYAALFDRLAAVGLESGASPTRALCDSRCRLGRRPACMGKPLSLDLRSRLVAAVSEGMSRRAAAERFGVSAASAVRWVEAVSTTGSVEAQPQGGDTRSHRIEAFSEVILAAVAAQKGHQPRRAGRIATHRTRRLLWSQHRLALP